MVSWAQGLVQSVVICPSTGFALGFALGWWQSFLLVAFSGSFVLDVADRQPQQPTTASSEEVAAVLGDLAQLVVQRLDALLVV